MMLQVNTKFLGQVARGWAQDRARRKAEREEEEERKPAPVSPAPATSKPAPVCSFISNALVSLNR